MNCRHARRLFGAYWDDEITQAEREALEGHFGGCAACRLAYEAFSRPLELMAGLPRVEAGAGFAESVLARVRHSRPAPDRLPRAGVAWVPVTAAAALLILAGTFVAPWVGVRGRGPAAPVASAPGTPPSAPGGFSGRLASEAPPEAVPVAPPAGESRVAATPGDSLFDHSADVEFILDPVTLRRGQATLSRQAPGAQGDRAVVSF